MLGLGSGSAFGGLTRYVVDVFGVPSAQFQVNVRSSLPASLELPENDSACPAWAMNVGTPLTLVVEPVPIVAVGSTFVTRTEVDEQLSVVSSSRRRPGR